MADPVHWIGAISRRYALPETDDNPLRGESTAAWDQIIEAIGPASILIVIERRMSDGLKRHQSPGDIFQDALMRAWRSRDQFEWRGGERRVTRARR